MNYKVAIDAGHGGSDLGNQGNGIAEKDYALLISNYIKDRLDDLGIENIITRSTDRDISDDERVNILTSAFGNDKNVIVVSNHLNKGAGEGLEVVYALRNSDAFAKKIADQVTSSGGVVNKYYQLRDPDNTQYDFVPIIRDTPNYETVMIEYGYVDNSGDASRIKNSYLDYAEAVVRAIALYTGTNYVPLPGANYYVVKKGDSLWKIATSYGISVDELKKANNLTSNNLDIGQLLFIPSEEKKETGVVYVVKAGDSLWKIANSYGVSVSELKSANNLKSDTLSIGQQLKIPSGGVSNTIYVVKAGDSLWKIANSYGVSVSELKSANNLTSDLLSIGQQLKIPGGGVTSTIYVVKAGDSLWKIANSYGISVSELKSANNLTSDLLSIGQQLKIPSSAVASTIYVVKAGDSLWKISNSYGVSVDDIKKLNNLTSNLLSIGQKLKIPSV